MKKIQNSTLSFDGGTIKRLRDEKKKDEQSLGAKLTWGGFMSRLLAKKNKAESVGGVKKERW